MTEIFTNISTADEREIKYLNYLTTVVSEKVFENVINCKKLELLQKKYQKMLTEARIILIPRQNFLQQTSFSYSEALFLKNPNKMLKDLNRAEQYFHIYKIRNLDLADLDEALSRAFRYNIKSWERNIVVLNKSTRFAQYKDVVYGINSEQCKYSDKINLGQFMQTECKKIYRKEETLRKFTIYYILGTTAVSTKGFTL